MIFPANLLTGAKHPACSTNLLADTNKTKCNYNIEHQKTHTTITNLKTTKMCTNKRLIRSLLHHLAGNGLDI